MVSVQFDFMTAVRRYCLQAAFITHPFDCWALASRVLYSTCSSPKPCRDSKPTEPPLTKVEGFSGLERLRRTVGSFPTEVGGFKPDFWKMN